MDKQERRQRRSVLWSGSPIEEVQPIAGIGLDNQRLRFDGHAQ